MKKNNYFLTIVLFIAACVVAIANGPAPLVTIDTDQIIDGAVTILKTDGVAANDLSNVTPATGRAALGLGTMAVATSTDYVATSSLAERLDTTNASITGDIDVAGDVGAATVNGVAPLTSIEKTQALVGSTAVNMYAQQQYVASISTLIDGNLYFGKVTLAPGASVDLEDLFSYTKAGTYYAKISLFTGSSAGWAEFYLPATTPILSSSYPSPGDWSVTDAASKLCVYIDGSNNFIIKNNYAGTTITFRIMLWI